MKLHKRAAILLLAGISTTYLHANDSILYTKAEYSSGHIAFERRSLDNPALRNIFNVAPLSNITLSGSISPSAKAAVPQMGKGEKFFNICVASMQHLSKHDAVWGNASYENGKRYDVVWNETSDFLELYPYVMADERGGDMNYERYELKGGYSARHNKIFYGAELGYRALQEYRSFDPRPNNTVADLHARIALGYKAFSKYVLALSVEAGKYKQTNELAYYNELGAGKEYHLTGLGNDYARFSGSNNNTFYKGWNVGATLDLAPTNAIGLSASLAYKLIKKEKTISDLNRLPLNKLKTDVYSVSAGYSKRNYGAWLNTSMAFRQGNDNIFGDASGNVYNQIGTQKNYKGNIFSIHAEGFWEKSSSKRVSWQLIPFVSYTNVDNKHVSSDNQFSTQYMRCGTMCKINIIGKKGLLNMQTFVNQRCNLATTLRLNSYTAESLAECLRQTEKFLSDGDTTFGLGIGYTIRAFKGKALTVGVDWQQQLYLRTEHRNTLAAILEFSL